MKKEENYTSINNEQTRLMIVEMFAKEYGDTLLISDNAMDLLLDAYYRLKTADPNHIPSVDEILDEAGEKENFIWILDDSEKYLLSADAVDNGNKELDDLKALVSIDDNLISDLEEANKKLNKKILQYKKFSSFSVAFGLSFLVTTIALAFRIRKKVK